MKEILHEQLSALVDDELGSGEQPMLLKQLGADPELREQLSRYQLISDALSHHLPPQVDIDFHKGIQSALQSEPAVHVQASVPSSRLTHLFKPLAGLAVAASVAVVAVFSLQTVRDETGSTATPAVAVAPMPNDYLRAEIPAQTVGSPRTPQSLNAYLVNHNEYAVNRGMLPYVRLVGHEMIVDGDQ